VIVMLIVGSDTTGQGLTRVRMALLDEPHQVGERKPQGLPELEEDPHRD
jgi:hypothetical protein